MKSQKKSNISAIIGLICSVVVLIVVPFFIYDGIKTNSYTTFYKNKLNDYLGKNNWEVIDKDYKTTSVFKERNTHRYGYNTYDDGTYKKWYIEYIDENGNEQCLILNNLTHKVSKSKKIFWDKEYVSNDMCLGMNIYDELEYLALDDICTNVLYKHFNEDNFEVTNPEYYEDGYTLQTSITYDKSIPNSYYQEIYDNSQNYYLPEYSAKDYFSNAEYRPYISINLNTYMYTNEQKEAIKEKVVVAVQDIIDYVGDDVSIEFTIRHYEKNERVYDYKYSDGIFIVQGKEISDIDKVKREGSSDTYYTLDAYFDNID